MTTASSRLLNRSWIESSLVFLLRQRSSECDGKGSEATAPALGGRGFDLLRRAGRRRGVHHPLRPPRPRSVLTWILSIGHNRSIDQIRSHASRRRTQDKIEASAPRSQPSEAFAQTWR